MWIDENLLTEAAGTTSIAHPDWCVNRSCAGSRVTPRWVIVRIVHRTVASFSRLNIHNFTNRTFIHSEILTSWVCSSTAVKRRYRYTFNTTVVINGIRHYKLPGYGSVIAVNIAMSRVTWKHFTCTILHVTGSHSIPDDVADDCVQLCNSALILLIQHTVTLLYGIYFTDVYMYNSNESTYFSTQCIHIDTCLS